MNPLDSDLEEGEILDSPPPPEIYNDKRKKLPRRYAVGDNKKNVHKHKEGCRHAIQYHVKKLSKLKKTPPRIKNSPKQYHKPKCVNEKSHKVPCRYSSSGTSKHALPNKSHFHQHSLIPEIKGPFKNVPPSNKPITNIDQNRLQNILFLKQVFNVSESEILAPEIDNFEASNMSKDSEHPSEKSDSNRSKICDVTIIDLGSDSSQDSICLNKNSGDVPSNTRLISDSKVKSIGNYVSNNSFQVKKEESDDEEELRRIALSTCVKRKALGESGNTLENIEYPCSVPAPDVLGVNNIQISLHETKIPSRDNYEVVDMEVDDEEEQDSLEIIQTSLIKKETKRAEDFFFIDTNPSDDFLQNKENAFSEPQVVCNSSDEEFEADILRAELLNSMYRKNLQDDVKQESKIKSPEKQMPLVQQKKTPFNYQSPNLMFLNKRLKSAKHFLRKRSVNKLENVRNNKLPSPVQASKPAERLILPVQASKPAERLIITLNEESSDDSDDSGEEVEAVSENPVDSIVALISDCRQKTESNVETKEKEVVPKAVSCLSKSQQEEYNSLMKILAKKKILPPAQGTVTSFKNGSVYSPSDDMKILDKKLALYQDSLRTKKDSMTLLVKEIKSNNFECKKANLTVQFLKEKLIAAEKVRKAKVLKLSKAHGDLKLAKQSASNLMKKIDEVKSLRSKLQEQSNKFSLLLDNKQS